MRLKPTISALIATHSVHRAIGTVMVRSLEKKYNLKPIPMASQVHINSLYESLNFKPWFENLKPRFKSFKPRLKTLNLGLKKKSVHLFFKPGFEVSSRGFSWPNAH